MLSLLQIPVYLGSIMLTLIPVSLPVCVVQLLLCRYCNNKYLRLAPVIAGGGLSLISICCLSVSYGYDALLALLFLFPALWLLSGSALGWFIWSIAQKRLR